MTTGPIYFKDAVELRQWFTRHAPTSSELVVGFMKTGSGAAGLSWSEAVDEALCVGWIDGVRHRVDDQRYRIRFTPRKPGSNWSAVNIRKAEALRTLGRMTSAGLQAYAARTEAKSRTASYEQQEVAFSSAELKQLEGHAVALRYFEATPPGYRKKITWWVVSAKQADTRSRRLASLIEACAEGRCL